MRKSASGKTRKRLKVKDLPATKSGKDAKGGAVAVINPCNKPARGGIINPCLRGTRKGIVGPCQ